MRDVWQIAMKGAVELSTLRSSRKQEGLGQDGWGVQSMPPTTALGSFPYSYGRFPPCDCCGPIT